MQPEAASNQFRCRGVGLLLLIRVTVPTSTCVRSWWYPKCMALSGTEWHQRSHAVISLFDFGTAIMELIRWIMVE